VKRCCAGHDEACGDEQSSVPHGLSPMDIE
jgi:hypothetical protein